MFAIKVLIISLLVVQGCVGSGYHCKIGFKFFNYRCFRFSGIQVTWQEAQDECKESGSSLAEPKIPPVDQWIAQQLSELDIRGAWLGGTDAEREGLFYWANEMVPIEYTNWRPGQPDNHNNEDCLHQIKYKWNDASCDTKWGFVCEMPAVYYSESDILTRGL